MPRKKQITTAEPAATALSAPTPQAESAASVIETSGRDTAKFDTSAPKPESSAPGDNTPPADGTGKHYGPPYKAIFTSADKGFELGENRRFKQRVFTFKDKPDEAVLAALKEHGFTYRPAEKAWTTEATAESRVLTDRLAKQFAGNDVSMSR